MRSPPRDASKSLVTRLMLTRIAISAGIVVLGTLYVFNSELADGVVTRRDTTMTFAAFVLFDLFNALSCRSARKSVFELGLLSNKAFV